MTRGYDIPTTCEHPDCDAPIDRGEWYRCHGDCGRFCCGEHLYAPPAGGRGFRCAMCTIADGNMPGHLPVVHVITAPALRALLQRVADGEDPETAYVAFYANAAEVDRFTGGD